MMKKDEILPTIDRIAEKTDPHRTMFHVTGGEPLLNPDWEEICTYVYQKGFPWGMTSNGTLIDSKMVERLAKAGMKTISISLDGLRENHEKLRGVPGYYDRARNAIQLLVESKRFLCVQVTTVVNPENITELEEMYELCQKLKIDSWKLTGVEPIGQARRNPELLLSNDDYITLFEFIKQKRNVSPFEVTYGCSHFLPLEYDNTVRRSHFLCGAGTLIASITCEGDIVACLDIDYPKSACIGGMSINPYRAAEMMEITKAI